ncbi:MAG: universal stress protein [Rhodobacteraceae bacterium]|jgi:nucleotide-binding universal stress UspA family protein|uniref:universal stress protein n=1 Tax=Albidovulum sp. TaxID=1872424 RepID=UPI001D82D355|nr:universal stress protein [uncultured Defluviimonas sp.]MCB2124804.1 universal stress protein [Paracoccaceae bacterium]MCC0071552.1 universal stress protein [Paracoccaceae bacterium]
MAFKSLLTVVTDPATAASQLDAAVALARREDAHLDVLCIGVDRTQTGYYYAGATAILTQEAYNQAKEEASTTEAAVKTRLEREDIRWGVDSAVAQIGAIGGPVAMLARFCDLVVLPKPYGKAGGPAAEAILEAALFEGHAPVLVLPEGFTGTNFGKRVVMAWNQSDEALMAARAALPLLKAASEVDITIIDPPTHGPERSDPGGMLSQYLARHGVHAEVSVLAKTLPRTSEVLSRHARDENADLIVMGAYGHSRFREAILGGATRNMLEMADIPVFMAH